MKITRTSTLSGIERTLDIPVDPEHLILWQSGSMPIQDAMPYLSDDDREFIISGITSQEWDCAFEPEEENLIDEL